MLHLHQLIRKIQKIKIQIVPETYPCFHQILCSNIDHGASNSLCRVEAKSVIFISFPWIKYTFCVYGPLVYCPRNRNIDQFTETKGDMLQKYEKNKLSNIKSIVTIYQQDQIPSR